MTEARVDVSVLIPVLNEERGLREVVAGMQAQRFDGDVEFLFVDGRSEDRTREILEELAAEDPRIRVLDNPARRTPQALNVGLRAARGDYVARMDGHTHYPPDYLARGVERLRAGGVDWVSGPQLAEGTGTWSRRVALALGSRLGTGGADFRFSADEEFEVDSGFTGVWTRETLERFDGWDEEWLNDQDFELAARIRKAGGRIVCVPGMAAQYVPRDSLARLWRQYHRYGFYRVKTSLRHPESLRRSHVLPPGVVAALAGAVVLPRPLRTLARAGVGLYALVLVAISARELGRGAAADVASLPLVFATMHLAWGIGFLRGCLELGPPVAAIRHAAGLAPQSQR
jgi:cellulose synthase/poly-beta-1,6-N-acetylglucosamine synthase-like glycosyltransferase